LCIEEVLLDRISKAKLLDQKTKIVTKIIKAMDIQNLRIGWQLEDFMQHEESKRTGKTK